MTPAEAQREKDMAILRRAGLCCSCAENAPAVGSDLCHGCKTGQDEEAARRDDARRSEW